MSQSFVSQPVEVFATMDAAKSSKAILQIHHLNSSERALIGGKILGLCWLAAIAFIFIPVLHFFLVPGALIAGIALGIRQFGLHEKWMGGDVTCPECQKVVPADLKPFNWPKHLECGSCGKALVFKQI